MTRSHQEIIHRSHKRSREYGIHPDKPVKPVLLSGAELKKVLARSEGLLDVTAPIMEKLYEFLKGSGFILILTDQNGCIIQISGDEAPLEEARIQHMVKGSYMTEKCIGTNAMGTALSENCPVQVTATEHFMSDYFQWTCSAAPIHDISGNIIGILNLTGKSSLVHPHTLGLAVAAVNAIENRIENAEIERQLHHSNQFAFAMMNNLAYGMFAIDMQNRILWVNDTACRSINIRRLHLINSQMGNLFRDWESVRELLDRHGAYNDEEGSFAIRGLKEKYLFSAYPISTKTDETLGYLLAFREFSRVLKEVNRYAGHHIRYSFDDLIGDSVITRDMISYCRTIARNTSTILISGETGTGKEIIAQSIHHASERSEGPFVAINCGAISESLIESELFGYVEGAFTDARKGGRPGKFELADKGTLFLDEIGEMALAMQVKLLRALQEKAVIRVGSDKPVPVDVRIIAATNKDLNEEVRSGRFRLDLYFRINVIEVKVPPLRERKEDILPLAKYFLKRKAAKLERPIPEIKADLMNRLVTYSWPGNIRELENLMERAVILHGVLPESSFGGSDRPDTTEYPMHDHDADPLPVSWNLDQIEKETIRKALSHFSGNISKTAENLGISRNTLYQKLKRHYLDF